jgi:hypothetical protein
VGLMNDEYVQPRSGVPLSHKVIALFIAVIVGGLLWVWLTNKAIESESAVLAFDPTLAQHVDSGLTSANKPAVALADSILNDQAIAGLAKQAHLSSSTTASQIGEFRSGVELTQPSSKVLRVRFLDSDPGRAAANANAVAQALAAWSPSTAGVPASAAPAQAVTPPAAPAPRTNIEDQRQENHPVSAHSPSHHALSDSLGALGAQLTATDQQLERLAAGKGSRQAAYTQSRQQKLLTAQVNASEKKLRDLRAKYGEEETDPNVKARLTEVQQAVQSILPAGERSGHTGHGSRYKAVGTSASQLRRERSALRMAIAVVNKDREAIARTEAASSASDDSSQAPVAPVSAPPATAETSSPVQEQTLPPATSGNPAPEQPYAHPLSMVWLASPSRPLPLWPAIALGFLCGVLYLGGAALAHRRGGTGESYAEESAYPQRFITPSGPVYRPSEDVRPADVAADLPAARTEPAEVEATSRRRAPFAFGGTLAEGDASRSSDSLRNSEDGASDPVTEPIGESPSETSIGGMPEGANQDASPQPPTEPRTQPPTEPPIEIGEPQSPGDMKS